MKSQCDKTIDSLNECLELAQLLWQAGLHTGKSQKEKEELDSIINDIIECKQNIKKELKSFSK